MDRLDLRNIPPPPFVSGEWVRLKTGTSKIMVLEVDYFICADTHSQPPIYHKRRYKRPMKGWYIRFAYASSLHYEHEGRKWREADDFVHYEGKQMDTLFKTKENPPRFGTMLTKTRVDGKIVLEMKGGGGDVASFNPSDIEEVLPYTVAIRRFTGGSDHSSENNRHYCFEEGSVEVGDVLLQLSNGSIWEVMQLDSRARGTRTSKNGFLKLEGKRLTIGE